MNNLYIKSLVFFFISGTMASCKNELNVFPTTQQVDGNLIVDAKSAATVLNGVYYRFANAGTDYNEVPSILWSNVHEAIPSELSGLLSNVGGEDGFGDFTLNKDNTAVPMKWINDYNIVNAANGFLKNIDPVTAISAPVKKQMQAEAKFLRAFANTDLLLYFGQYNDPGSKYGIILRDTFVSSEQVNLPRSGVAAAYTSILADLDAAIQDLPSLNTKISYANLWVAKLLKARLLMNRGSSGDYNQVISLTNDVIKNSPFVLEDQVKDVFLTKGFQSKEVMLGIQPFPTESYKFSQYQYYNQYVGSKSLENLFLDDPRAGWIYKAIVKRGETVNEITKYYSGSVTQISQTPLSVNSYAFRLTEAYLLSAEAITVSGGDLNAAKTFLKTVLGHAGITDFSSVDAAQTVADVQLLVVKEEMRNFVAENGLDWLALRRLPFATLQLLRPAIKSQKSLILPIPSSEIKTNNQVEQNIGY